MKFIQVLASAALAAANDFTKPDPSVSMPPMNVLVSMTFGSRSHIKNVFEIGKMLQARGHSVGYMTIEPYMRFADGHNFTRHRVGPVDIEVDDHRGTPESSLKMVNPLVDTLEALTENMPHIYRTTFDDILKTIDETQPDVMICDFFSFPCIDAAYKRHIPLITGFQTLDGPILPPPYITGSLSYFPHHNRRPQLPHAVLLLHHPPPLHRPWLPQPQPQTQH
ncbi:hypothetical protein DSO57_1014349 [Entomophthora muscae]|uniref:Uncharacterized protein n=1 Tax=Entomophthora muscae TaxID=34485 RepID=A0ACC2T5V4_9FUNG|nr:hypothetical protein DSO57_1014349 [Entomophthora muscae]